MLFTETWITNEHSQAEYSLKGYQEPVICPKARGGTCIFVKEGLNFYQVQPPENMDDSTWIVVCTMNNIRRLYGCIYRSPNSSTENNERLMANLIWADENFKEVICVGDFNYPEITWPAASSVSQTARQFLETFSELGWSQKIEQPTRYRYGQQPSLLDLIMVSNVNLIATTEIAMRGDMINMYKYINADQIFTLRDNSIIQGNDKAVRLSIHVRPKKTIICVPWNPRMEQSF